MTDSAARPLQRLAPSLLLAAALAAPAVGLAQQTETLPAVSSTELKQLSIEDLMGIDVTSVSKRPEKLSTAAAAITVVTADDIRRSGAITLPDALRLVPGLQVAQADGQTWAISVRGFNNNSADKLLVLIDGRTVYSPLFSGVFWDSQDVMLADIDRIEVIRGPGAALWGANAVNGVINIITKKAGATQGGLAEAGTGVNEPGFGSLRYGGKAGDLAWRVYGTYFYTPSMVNASGMSADDPLRRGQGGFRSDWTPATGDTATVQGDVYKGLIGVGGGDLLGRWAHVLAPDSDVTLQAYADFTRRDDPTVYEEHRRTFDLDLQHHYTGWTDQNLVWGAGYRLTADSLVDSSLVAWVPDRRSLEQASTFAQDEISFPGERLRLILGSRFEYNTLDHFEAEPNVRLAWTPDDRQNLWGAVSRAARTPTRLDDDVRILSGPLVVITGNPDFRSELVTAYEVGYRAQAGASFSYDVATFYNVYDRLRTTEPLPDGVPAFYYVANMLKGSTYGGELAANFQMTSFWRWSASYSYLAEKLRLEAGSQDPSGTTSAGDDPKYQTFLRSSLDLPRRTELDATLRRVDSLPAPFVPAYTELDLRLGWRPIERLELALVGRNLLHAHHPEFGPDDPTRLEVQRTGYLKVTWHF